MKLTANIKLQCNKEQHQKLFDTLIACNEACNYISTIAFTSKAFGQYSLHKLTYYVVKEKFNLSAQIVVRCIAKVADSYKLSKKVQIKFRQHSAQPFDSRIFRFMKDDYISITTLKGREKIPFQCGAYQRKLITSQIGEVDLLYIKKHFYIACVCDVDEEQMQNPEKILGIDLGIVNIAVDSEGTFYSGRDVEIYRKKMLNRRKNLQKKGTKAAKRKLKAISKKQQRFQKNTNHCISKAIVEKAKRLHYSIKLEDLRGIRDSVKANKSTRSKIANWGFYQLKSFIEYKAKLAGILVELIDPKNTSRTCPKCSYVHKSNRRTQSIFKCKQCGFEANADLVASWNIRDKVAVNRPMVGKNFVCA